MMERINNIRTRVTENIELCDSLSEADMWTRHGNTIIWQAKRFTGTPHFYPVYRWKDYYSYSILALIIKKGCLDINHKAIKYIKNKDFLVLPASLNIDMDIERIGKPHNCGSEISDIEKFAQRLAVALVSDIKNIEEKNKGYKNYILCGGKDSLNLLLLPWQNDTIALSAEPNYRYVKQFVKDNKLNIEVHLLEDKENDDELDDEILECCCRVDMENWRWGEHLRQISKKNSGRVVFWKGQMADLYTSDKWKVYMHPNKKIQMFAQKVYRKLAPILPFFVNHAIGNKIQPIAVQAAWDRGAVMQGGHLAFIREIADCLVLSAYHGKEVMKVWQEVDLASVAQHDMRDRIGEILFKQKVIYPEKNPSPSASFIRSGLGTPDKFIALLKRANIDTCNGNT